MKRFFIVFIYLLILSRAYPQSKSDASLIQLSKNFQTFFNDMRWSLHVPLSSSGLIFTKGPTFYRIKDSVHWSKDEYRLMNKFVVNHENVRDSIIYMILGVNDSLSSMQIVDVYEYDHLKYVGDEVFPNPGLSAEFAGGNRKFCDSFKKYLNNLEDIPNEFSAQFKLFFEYNRSGIEMSSLSENSWLKKQLDDYLTFNPIKYNPAIRFGRPIHSLHEYKVNKSGNKITVENVDYGESFFMYKDSLTLYFIEPISSDKRLIGNRTFVYDSKWSEEDFFASTDIVRIGRELNNSKLKDVLIKFRNNSVVKPFSTVYCIIIEKL